MVGRRDALVVGPGEGKTLSGRAGGNVLDRSATSHTGLRRQMTRTTPLGPSTAMSRPRQRHRSLQSWPTSKSPPVSPMPTEPG